ncbi:MAG: PspC domain-containing protein [Eubacteriaceae bacterium]|nr:PspC domain-containing protein [Eubacteriaceae bacterium]MBR5995309.1 PspC domain-containing protein [Eubacteriaceae bacterium]
MKKKLCRDSENGMLFGVLVGLSEYIGIKANILRVIYVLACCFMSRFAGVIIYIVLAFIMPDKKDVGFDDYTVE